GQPGGTYSASSFWDLHNTVSPLLGVNTTALVGYSVAGARNVRGVVYGVRGLVGGPSNSLDFGAGLLKLGNTLGTTFDLVFDDNGIGKAYTFTFTSCNITLPATLLSFDRQIVEKTVVLKWTTTAEENLSHYELQHSTDGSQFEVMAMVFAKGEQRNNYQYTDKNPVTGTNYYRLRIIDNNGQYKYSNILSAKFGAKEADIVVAPNPAINNEIKVRMTDLEPGQYRIELHNTIGQLLQTKAVVVNQSLQSETMSPSTSMMPGVYWINVIDKNNARIKTLRVLVNK
ncbi:MAG TPA: T9SS type A sorting domain-containing protein, partial [Chitinophagaceae bacterium]